MGWRGGKRRLVAVAGAASVVLGFLCALVVVPLLWDTTWTAATAVAMAAVPLLVVGGFILLWEGLITWRDDGSPYPLRRRAKAAVAVLATAAVYLPVVVLISTALAPHLPPTWWGHEVTQGVAVVIAVYLARAVWRRLRTGHLSQGPSAS